MNFTPFFLIAFVCYNGHMNDKINFLQKYLPQVRLKLLDDPIQAISTKSKFDDIVTDVDILIQNELITTLQKHYPDTTFLAEEEGQLELSPKLWIIDPIDGTKNFVRKHADYAISIAYYEDLKPVFGIDYDIVENLLFIAEKGKGATINGQVLSKSVEKKLNEAIIDINLNTVYFYQEKHKMSCQKLNEQAFAHRCYGSAALSLVRIACGSHDVYLNNKLSLWDYAAGQIILEEVGGVVEFPYHEGSFLNDKSVVLSAASSKKLLDEVKEVMKIN